MSFEVESPRRTGDGDAVASLSVTAPPAPTLAGRRQQGQAPPVTVQPVLYSSALAALAASPPPSVEYATPGRALASFGDGVDNGGRRRRRTNNDSQRMRAEVLALARSPGYWRPLLVFVFSLVIGVALALAAYKIRGSRLSGRAMSRRGNGTY
ncbi:uncharacterized protein LOC119441089 [Dermacentor silvarum]|uniref:uncharacterized protein LOC119441089 n=1 Tax=Dermacentor silvarum TaxID=543639 RepID=UPI00189BB699|nr:uncharacterized protein LOC119441089 [Dermacentor silvarum]